MPRRRPRARIRSPRERVSRGMSVSEAITALTTIGALIFTGLSLNATRDQVGAAHRQNAVAEQGQYTDRYTRSVEQLDRTGPDHLQGRLGAVYALERLAKDSPRDQPTIVEILSAFVRTNRAPAAADNRISTCPEPQPLAPDAKAALTVLSRRDVRQDNGARTDLTGVNLRGAGLSGAVLREADLEKADLSGAVLARADLSKARLVLTAFGGANLPDARHNNDTDVREALTDSATTGKWW